MSYKIFPFVIMMLLSKEVFCQHNFDSIRICHDNGELNNITIGEYEVKVREGLLSKVISKDGAVQYEDEGKVFTLKNLTKGNSLTLQLVKDGIAIGTKDSSFVLSSPKSINLPSNTETGETYGLYSINGFSFTCEFLNDKIKKLRIPTTGKYVVFNLVQIQGIYTWDFLIESVNHANQVLLTYSFNAPYSLSIHDDKNKVGIRLLSKKKNGFFTLLQGIRVYGNNSFASDEAYKLQYTKKGKLKKKSGFNLTCQ